MSVISSINKQPFAGKETKKRAERGAKVYLNNYIGCLQVNVGFSVRRAAKNECKSKKTEG